MIFEFYILTTSYHVGHAALFVLKLYNHCWTALEESWISGTVLLTQPRTTDAQRGSSLHCMAENSTPIPNF